MKTNIVRQFILGFAALAAIPAFSQCVDLPPGPDLSAASAQAQTDNTGARVVGGLVGAGVGALLTRNSGTLGKFAGILGLGYLGQTAGDIATRKVTDQNGQPVVQTGTDSRGQPTYAPILTTAVRPGQTNFLHMTSAVYDDAVRRAAAVTPAPATVGADGKKYKVLSPEMSCGLYGQMIEAVAQRKTAVQANADLDAAEMARSVGQNQQTIAAFSVANKTFNDVFRTYSAAYQKLSSSMSIAVRNNYDISAQQLLMGLVPSDIRQPVGVEIHWPGVDARVAELQMQMQD